MFFCTLERNYKNPIRTGILKYFWKNKRGPPSAPKKFYWSKACRARKSIINLRVVFPTRRFSEAAVNSTLFEKRKCT